MTARLRIALDAMGGDHAPDMVVAGAEIARERCSNLSYLFVGDEARIGPLLDRYPALKPIAEIRHAPDAVAMDAKPSQALRNGRSSSMRLAIDAVANGEAACVVSAGNTGALMAMAKFVLKTLPGVDRPAIASFFPTMRGESVMLDLGANLECDADNLVQFAVMGAVFSRTVLGLLEPTIGLLNVGSEEQKGHEGIREAAATLRRTPLARNFHGFVEGNDIGAGTVDVIVTDGFTGNVALKTAEGTAKLFGEFLRRTFKSSWLASIGYLLARGAFQKLKLRTDPRRYNGAMFLGLRGVCVKSHGGTDAVGFANAICVARDLVQHDFNDRICEELAKVQAALAPFVERALDPTETVSPVTKAAPPLMLRRSVMLGVGAYLPARVLTNDELAGMVDTSDAWIVERTGIRTRHIAADGETTSDLALSAARAALDQARVGADEIDLIVLATATPDRTFPATAVTVQAGLGLTRGMAFDVQAVCSGFVYALAVADNFLRVGQARTALVIGAETFSRILDWTDRTTCVLFGDGAGAVVLRAEDPRPAGAGILSTHLHSDGRHQDLLYVDGGPSTTQTVGHLRMRGQEVFKHAVVNLASVVYEALNANGLEASAIDWLIPHQANRRIIDGTARKLKLDPGKVVLTVDRHGNTSAASIPLALAEAVNDGRIRRGDLLLLEAMGGGFTWGAALIRW